ncbi:hypothetical protein COCNU_08G012000 [Cocos nucifera]|uniref:Helicase protein MOM1 n=1 Tax=Cocos nucifera TaxID=13894 RepID=A0A8K0III1_COCNU|nr:hypothetical protein COCNU_08G012000 [Cocos nucifera]
MVSGTRSGRLNKDEGTSNSKTRSAGEIVKDMKGSIASGSTANGSSKCRNGKINSKYIKSTTTLGNASMDSSNLRRPTRGAPMKKMSAFSGLQKSGRAENQTPASSDKWKMEGSEKKRPQSPLRRSERIEKYNASSSSGSKMSNKSSSPLMEMKKVKEVNNEEKLMESVTKEESKDKKIDVKRDGSLKKRKRLDARSYRASLKPQAKKPKSSDATTLHQKDVASHGDKIDSGGRDSAELQKDGLGSSERKGEDLRWKCSNENFEEAVEGSSSDSKDLVELTLGNEGKRKIPSSSMKHEYIETNEPGTEDSCSQSKCCGMLLQSSPVGSAKDNSGGDVQRENDVEGDRINAYGFDREEFGTAELVESSAEDRALAGDLFPESGAISVRPSNKQILILETSTADASSSSPSMTEKKTLERCTVCSKLKRGQDSEDQELCSCKHPTEDEEVLDPRKDGTVAGCHQGVEAKGNSVLETREHFSGTAMQSLIASADTVYVTVSMDGDRGRLEVSDCIGAPNEQPGSTYLKESSMEIQTESDANACIICKHPGLLLCCDGKGCKRSYHLSCLDPPLQSIPPGLWLCTCCMKKKIEFGVHSVSKGIESVWDVKEGMQNGKVYLVKYEGISHVHNRWIPESQMLLEAPTLVSKFNRRYQKEKVIRWKQEWTVPHRLLQKRLLMPLKLADEFFCGLGNNISYCYHEWLVKWKGLDHEYATWEFENSPFLCSSDGKMLIKDYETRREEAKKAYDPSRIEKKMLPIPLSHAKVKKNPFYKLPRLPDGCPPGLDNDHLNSVNRLREFWHKSQNAVFIDDQDFENLECIGWEAIIVDECQNSRVFKHLEQFKNLSTDFKLLLSSAPLKDSLAEYLKLLLFLDSGGKENCISNLKFDHNDHAGTLAILKERLARYHAYERKPDSSKFIEYWVPVQFSNVQLEQYCFTLISNSIALRSCSKVDHVGALRDVLISTRKCCDHPYLVEKLLQTSLTKDLPAVNILDVGVNASGKLLLLDKILKEIKNRGLRVLILFQSIGGAGRNSIGDILDDFLRQRFGADSYERVDSGLVLSKKLAALSMFNDKGKGRFVFLIENRACLPSVKLSSVDAIIIYNSDWNPLNDLRSLQKISLEPQFEQVAVFRLYSSCTIEEKVLIFAKQDMILESNIQSISPSVSHSLLSWGASYLFSKLDELHQQGNQNNCSENSSDNSFLDNVVLELLTKLSSKDGARDPSNCSILIKAQQSGASYSRNIMLVGEKDGISSLNKDPPNFWSNLLDGKYPQWRYISEPSQRSRRKVQQPDDSLKTPEAVNDELKKKRRKVASNIVDPTSLQSWLQDKRKEAAKAKDFVLPANSTQCGSSHPSLNSPRKELVPSTMTNEPELSGGQRNVVTQHTVSSCNVMSHAIHNQSVSPMSLDDSGIHRSEGREKLMNAQRSLHAQLKPELSKLCDTLRLSCWCAASILKHDVDHQESFACAKKYLNFECNEELAEFVYYKLRKVKKRFSHRTGALKKEDEPNLVENQSSLSGKNVSREPVCEMTPNSAASHHQEMEGDELRENPHGCRCTEQKILVGQEQVLATPMLQHNIGSLKDELLKKRVDLIHKICSRRADELMVKQQLEISDFNIHKEEEKMKLKKAHDLDLELIRTIHTDSTVRNDKIRLLNQEFSKKMAAFEEHMKCKRGNLEVMQLNARNKEEQIKDHWVEEAKAGKLAESFDSIPLPDSGFGVEEFNEVSEQSGMCDGPGNTVFQSGPSSDPLFIDVTTDAVETIDLVAKYSEKSARNPTGGAEGVLIEPETVVSQSNNMNEMESVEPSSASGEIPESISLGETGNMPTRTEDPASQASIMNSEGSRPDRIVSRVTTAVDSELVVGADNSDGAWLMSSHLQSHAKSPSLVNALTSSGCRNGVTSNQEHLICEHERPPASVGVVGDQGPDSSQQIAVPPLHSIDVVHSQVEQTNRNATISDSVDQGSSSSQQIVDPALDSVDVIPSQPINRSTTILDSLQLQLPPSTDMPLVEHGRGSASRCIESQEVSHRQIHCSGQQTEAPLQQPNMTATVPIGQSSQLVLHLSQPLVHPSPLNASMPPERPHSEDLRSTSVQPESGSHLSQPFHMAPLLPPQGLQPEPLKNELTRLRIHQDSLTKLHDDKKLQLELERDQELERVRKKYDALLKDAETEFLRNKEMIETIYNKVYMNQILAEEFRAKFIENKGSTSASFHGQFSNSLQHFLRASRMSQASPPQVAQRPVSATLVPASTPATLPPAPGPAPTPSLLASARTWVPGSAGSLVSSGQMIWNTTSVVLSNVARSRYGQTLTPRANLQVGSETRAPAPHLHRFRPHTSTSVQNLVIPTNEMSSQQRALANLGSASSTSAQAAAPSHVHPSLVAINGTCQAVSSDILPVCRGSTLAPVDLPLDTGDPQIGADLQNLSQLADLSPNFDRCLSSNLALMGGELPQSCMDVARRFASTDVVCISDDD